MIQRVELYRNKMSRSFSNFTGAGQLANSPGTTGMRPRGWSANGSANAMSTAPQYIIQVSNASAAAVSNFDVFGAAQYLMGGFGGGTWSGAGDFTLNGVTITSVFGNVTYQQILNSSMAQPFTAGGVYLQAITGNSAQISDVYQLNSTSAGGEQYSKSIKPFIDPNQFQNGITYNNQSFNVTSLTKLTWKTIYASAVFQITIFPANIIDPSQALNNGAVQSQFNSPKVIGNLK